MASYRPFRPAYARPARKLETFERLATIQVVREQDRQHARLRQSEHGGEQVGVLAEDLTRAGRTGGVQQPGEGEEDFEATMDLVETIGFANAYSFKYSPRPGTPAADSADQIPEAVKTKRLWLGMRTTLCTVASVPTSCKSAGFGASRRGSSWAATTIERSSPRDSIN